MQNRTRRDAMYDPDYVVYSGAWRRGFPENVRWFWSLYGVVLTRTPGTHTDGVAATLEAAKAEFGASWKRCGSV